MNLGIIANLIVKSVIRRFMSQATQFLFHRNIILDNNYDNYYKFI